MEINEYTDLRAQNIRMKIKMLFKYIFGRRQQKLKLKVEIRYQH